MLGLGILVQSLDFILSTIENHWGVISKGIISNIVLKDYFSCRLLWLVNCGGKGW